MAGGVVKKIKSPGTGHLDMTQPLPFSFCPRNKSHCIPAASRDGDRRCIDDFVLTLLSTDLPFRAEPMKRKFGRLDNESSYP